MLGGLFLEVLGRLASKKFDDFLSERRKMALELLIVKVVNQCRLFRIAPHLLLPAGKYLSLQIFDVVGQCWFHCARPHQSS